MYVSKSPGGLGLCVVPVPVPDLFFARNLDRESQVATPSPQTSEYIQRGSSRLARLGRTTTELTYEPTASPRRALDVPMASGLCTYSHYHPRALSMAICRVVICTAKIL